MKRLVLLAVLVVGCDMPSPCDKAYTDHYSLSVDIAMCKSDACVQWYIAQAAESAKLCEESKRR